MGRAVRPGRRTLPEGPAPRARRSPVVGVLAVLAVATWIFSRATAPTVRGEPLDVPPAAARGVWSTGDPRYGGRAIWILENEVVFERGTSEVPLRANITGIRTWAEGEATVLRIEYVTPEGDEAVEVILDAQGRMRLRNPPDAVWTRR